MDGFKKDSLDEKSDRYLHNLITYEYNLSLQVGTINKARFKLIDSLLKQKPDKLQTAIVNLIKAKFLSQENKIEASRLTLNALEVFEKHNDTTGLIQSFSLLYFFTQPKFTGESSKNDKLNEVYLKRVEELSAHSHYNLDRLVYYNLKMENFASATSEKDNQEVITVFDKAVKIINDDPKMEFLRGEFYSRMAERCYTFKDYKGAEGYYNKILHFTVVSSKHIVYYSLGVIKKRTKRYDQALDYVSLAQSEYKKSKAIDILGEYLQAHMRADLYYKLKVNKDSIIRAFANADSLNNILIERNKDRLASELQNQYEFDKKESEIQMEKSENFWLLLFAIVLCLTIIIISILFWYNNKIKNKLASEIKLKEDIHRVISHDMLSPLVSLEMIVGMNVKKINTQNLEELKKNVLLEQKYIQVTKLLCENLISWLWVDTLKTKHINHAIIKEIIEEIIESLEPFLKLNECTVYFQTETNDSNTYAFDGNAFGVVFRNLLTNTARHAKATKIQVVLGEENHQLYLRIYDNGSPLDGQLKKEIESYINNTAGNNFGRLGSRI